MQKPEPAKSEGVSELLLGLTIIMVITYMKLTFFFMKWNDSTVVCKRLPLHDARKFLGMKNMKFMNIV